METKEYYCGIDIHKDNYVACLMDKDGNEIRSLEFKANKESLQQFLVGIPNSDCTMTIENCTMWRYAYKILNELGFNKIKLADAIATKKLIGSKKTDYYDAKALADLTRSNLLPQLYIPNEDILHLRDLTHHLMFIREIIRKHKVKIKSELQKQGLKYSPKIWNSIGFHWLKSLKNNTVTSLVFLLEKISQEEKKIHSDVKKIAKSLKQTQLLMTIQGVGEYLALVIYAEIGTISRFLSVKKFVMYSGLCPGINQSGNSSYNIKNLRYNRTLKHAFQLASGRASIMADSYFQKKYLAIKAKKDMPKARRIIAQKMAIITWNMLTKNQEFKI